MDDEDRLGSRRDRLFHGLRIEAEGVIDIGKNRYGSGQKHGFGISDKGERRQDDLIARADAARSQSTAHRCGAAGTDMGITDLEPLLQGLFKLPCLPLAQAGGIKPIAHIDASIQNVHHLFPFFIANQLKTGHVITIRFECYLSACRIENPFRARLR